MTDAGADGAIAAKGCSLLGSDLTRLYERARAAQWEIDTDIDWAAMPLQQLAPSIRRAMSGLYTYIHHAESFGLAACGRLVDIASEGSVRQFLATQVIDEARHVDFFSRVLTRLDSPTDVTDGVVVLGLELQRMRSLPEIVVHLQLLESAAQTLFVASAALSRELSARAIRLPGSEAAAALVSHLSSLVGRDEARHIAFGVTFLKAHFEDATERERSATAQEARIFGTQVLASLRELRPHMTALRMPVDEMFERIWSVQRRQFAKVGLEIGDAPHE